jgi:hypothetical protein
VWRDGTNPIPLSHIINQTVREVSDQLVLQRSSASRSIVKWQMMQQMLSKCSLQQAFDTKIIISVCIESDTRATK